jgi:hypothetical protein
VINGEGLGPRVLAHCCLKHFRQELNGRTDSSFYTPCDSACLFEERRAPVTTLDMARLPTSGRLNKLRCL